MGSVFLYCEVPNGSKQSAGYFNQNFLKTANFYVAGAPQPSFWGTSYIGGSQFNGQMVCLNNGFVFVGGGQPANFQQPTQPMIPTMEAFASGFVTKTEATTYQHTADAADWLRMDASALMAKGSKNTFHDPFIKAMLLAPEVEQYASGGSSGSGTTDNLPGTAGGQLPSPLFYKTITKFRTPTTIAGFGGLKLKQMEGNGFLNVLLNHSIDTSDSKLRTALKNLASFDKAYKESLTFSGNKASYGAKEREQLRQKQEAVAQALGEQQVPTTQYGFSPDGNPNAYNLYVYEIDAQHAHSGTMTPSLHALLRNQPNSYIPLKEYVVPLKADGSMTPLLIPKVTLSQAVAPQNSKKSKQSSAQSGYTLQMVPNPEITYITSLTTGLTYEAGQQQGKKIVANAKGQKMSDVKLLSPYLDSDGNPDFSMATQTLSNIGYQLAQAGSIGKGALNQIVAMANYTTDSATNGPFSTYTGYTFTRVPLLELLKGDALEQDDKNIEAMGEVLATAANKAIIPARIMISTILKP